MKNLIIILVLIKLTLANNYTNGTTAATNQGQPIILVNTTLALRPSTTKELTSEKSTQMVTLTSEHTTTGSHLTNKSLNETNNTMVKSTNETYVTTAQMITNKTVIEIVTNATVASTKLTNSYTTPSSVKNISNESLSVTTNEPKTSRLADLVTSINRVSLTSQISSTYRNNILSTIDSTVLDYVNSTSTSSSNNKLLNSTLSFKNDSSVSETPSTQMETSTKESTTFASFHKTTKIVTQTPTKEEDENKNTIKFSFDLVFTKDELKTLSKIMQKLTDWLDKL